MRKWAENILELYLSTSWHQWNRRPAGVIGIFLVPIMWIALTDEIFESVETFAVATGISLVFFINALPPIAFIIVGIAEVL